MVRVCPAVTGKSPKCSWTQSWDTSETVSTETRVGSSSTRERGGSGDAIPYDHRFRTRGRPPKGSWALVLEMNSAI
jgi:hypothetical protein